MTSMFPDGTTLTFTNTSSPVRVVRLLGSGTQGQVFEVDFAGELMAMKWYFPGFLKRDPSLRNRINACIHATPPNPSFLWPILILDPDSGCSQRLAIKPGGFGYVMKLRPAGYVAAVDHIAGRVQISLQQLLRACFHLAEAFHALHSKGLCYKDISLGNLFLDPASGRILIYDNDNVDVNGRDLGGVRGTPGFMAPEVLLGQSRPSSGSDLFSLAVLLFRLLTCHDPYRGRLEMEIRCLDEPARRRLYGEDPVFIFALGDERNRPDPVIHPAPLLTWPIYPTALQALFEQTLAAGARHPGRRAYTSQWIQALAGCLDKRGLCPHCGQEVFVDPLKSSHCWACGKTLPNYAHFLTPGGAVLAQAGNELHSHHFNPMARESLDEPIGRIQQHPDVAGLFGIKNLSPACWRGELCSGATIPIPPGKTCSLSTLAKLHTHLGSTHLASQSPAS